MKTLKCSTAWINLNAAMTAILLTTSFHPLTSASATLTGACVFDADALGESSGIQVWNTTAEEARWNLWVTDGRPGSVPDGLTTPFINGPNDSSAAIAVPLQRGTNRFTIYGEISEIYPFYGLNLFFGGQGPFPGISVLAPLRTNDVIPSFQPNAAPITYGLDEFPIGGAGSLSAVDGDDVILLTEFYWASPEVHNRDRVNVDFIEPSGEPDFIGTFTLVVAPPHSGGPKASARVSQMEICWPSVAGHLYQVQYRTTLEAGEWNNLGIPSRADAANQCVQDDSLDPSRRFYRVIELPSP